MLTRPSNLFSNRSCVCETLTLVFATLKLIFLTLGVAGGIAGILVSYTHGHAPFSLQSLLSVQICGLLLVPTALLFHGVVKKSPEYIQAYFVFGVAMLFLTNFGIVAFATFLNRPDYRPFPPFPYWDFTILATIVIAQVVYAIILTVIYKTFWKIKETAKILDEHKQLLVDKILDEKFSVPVYFQYL